MSREGSEPTREVRNGIVWTTDEELTFASFQVMQDPDTWTFAGESKEGARFASLSNNPEHFKVEVVDRDDPHSRQLGSCAISRVGETWTGLESLRDLIRAK